jgi:ribosomal protein S18 acetylase RimI-like enzyme
MRITSTRLATEADAKAIAELVNDHELSVDSKSSLMSEQGALNFIAGYVDPSFTHLISINDEPGFSAVVNLHPDALKSRYFADVYADPHLNNLDSVVLWAIDLAKSEHDDWDMWPGANSLDKRLQSAWTNHGFEFLRRYYTMRMNQPTVSNIRQIENLEIRAIDIANPDEVALWHKVHQNSFSKHFGFAPRDLEKWRSLVLSDVNLDPNGVFLAFKNGEPVGFCECNDEYAEENKGLIAGLGVTQENQGLGIGEALLQTGIVYSASKGYDTVELNVDTGNESGALKLYEKVGFEPESSWIQLSRPRTR